MDDTHPIFEEGSCPLDSLLQSNENPHVKVIILGEEASDERTFVTTWGHFRQVRNFEKLGESLLIFHENASATTETKPRLQTLR